MANLVTGVTRGFTTKMEIFGVGYRVQLKGSNLEFAFGLQPSRTDRGPGGYHFRGGDAHEVLGHRNRQAKVGQISANIRRLRRPGPYKGKGCALRG